MLLNHRADPVTPTVNSMKQRFNMFGRVSCGTGNDRRTFSAISLAKLHRNSLEKGPSTPQGSPIMVATRRCDKLIWGRGPNAVRLHTALNTAVMLYPDDNDVLQLLDDMLVRSEYSYTYFNKPVRLSLYVNATW